MKTKYLILVFSCVVLAQLFVPAQMIFGKEKTLNRGTAYKFKTRPVDPTDPFRGKYITLNYDINKTMTTDSIWERNMNVYLYLKTDSLGYAAIYKCSKIPLEIENDYVMAKTSYYNKHEEVIRFRLPFNRFYMEESKAKPAEDAFRRASRDTVPTVTYGLVYVNEGDAVLKDVFINEIPIAEYIEQ
jgi:uncharacterized membrane-anchored protein